MENENNEMSNNRFKKISISVEKIKLIVYDFDGVMTNNTVIFDEYGKESVLVNRSDGLAVSLIKKLNIPQIIISSEENAVVIRRAKKLGIPAINCAKDKTDTLMEYCFKNNCSLTNVAFIGNDVNDKKVLENVGHPICPIDAHPTIKSICKTIINKKGGDGVIRRFYDMLIDGMIK